MVELTEGIRPEHLYILYSDSLISRVGDDDSPAAPVFHPLAKYLSAWVDGEFVGAFLAIRYSECEIEIHNLLTMRAVKHCRVLSRMCLEWVFTRHPVSRVTGYIREGIPSAVNHCRKVGLREEGFRRDAIRVGGKLEGLHVMGITRKEWEAL